PGCFLKRKAMNNSPPFKRHSVGRTYPWQVAPQQSLLPFRFNNTKFKSVNYIYNLSKFPATFRSTRIDLLVRRSRIASDRVGSPMMSYQTATGNCDEMIVALRPCLSSITSMRSRRE